jgi:hypothetical protein
MGLLEAEALWFPWDRSEASFVPHPESVAAEADPSSCDPPEPGPPGRLRISSGPKPLLPPPASYPSKLGSWPRPNRNPVVCVGWKQSPLPPPRGRDSLEPPTISRCASGRSELLPSAGRTTKPKLDLSPVAPRDEASSIPWLGDCPNRGPDISSSATGRSKPRPFARPILRTEARRSAVGPERGKPRSGPCRTNLEAILQARPASLQRTLPEGAGAVGKLWKVSKTSSPAFQSRPTLPADDPPKRFATLPGFRHRGASEDASLPAMK